MREALLGVIADSLPHLISYVDPEQRYLFNNKAYLDWFGRPPGELYGRTVRETLGDAAYETIRPHLEAVLAGQRVEYEARVTYRGAGTRDVHGIYVPHCDEDGKLLGYVSLVADVTRERRAEQELRTAKEEAEAASRMKDQFLATLSHELRTPLNAILGWAQLLRSNTADGETRRRGIAAIERGARTQAQIVNDLLDVSRIISGNLRLDVRSVSLPEVIDAALAAVVPAAEARRVSIEKAVDPLAGPVLGDPQRLQQVVWNLLSNAVKFTPDGGRVELRLERAGPRVELRVSDNGEGISPDFLPFVFEHFRQADASASRRHGGLGLGLSIVRQIVEMHGGTVQAESAGEGRGATFRVLLPVSGPAAG